jgi:hypothetical protein
MWVVHSKAVSRSCILNITLFLLCDSCQLVVHIEYVFLCAITLFLCVRAILNVLLNLTVVRLLDSGLPLVHVCEFCSVHMATVHLVNNFCLALDSHSGRSAMTEPNGDDHELEFESIPSDGGGGVEEQNNQVEELTAALQQAFPSSIAVSIVFNQPVPEPMPEAQVYASQPVQPVPEPYVDASPDALQQVQPVPEPHVDASPDALQPVQPVPEPHVEARPDPITQVRPSFGWRSRYMMVRSCPRECELSLRDSNGNCKIQCVHDRGHEGIHTCSACCERWRQLNAFTIEDTPSAQAAGAQSAQAAAQSEQEAAIQFDPFSGRCVHRCPHRGPCCVFRCGRPSGHHEHECWCCHLVRVGAVHDTRSDSSRRFTKVQRQQRTDFIEAWADFVCPTCGMISKSTTGSNSNFLRMKCAVCAHLFCRRVVIWPRNNDDARRQLDGFHRSVIRDGIA